MTSIKHPAALEQSQAVSELSSAAFGQVHNVSDHILKKWPAHLKQARPSLYTVTSGESFEALKAHYEAELSGQGYKPLSVVLPDAVVRNNGAAQIAGWQKGDDALVLIVTAPSPATATDKPVILLTTF